MRVEPRTLLPKWLAALFVGAAAPAAACGFCVEDRMAAVYDQALIESAFAQHRHVAFFALEGAARTDQDTRRAVLLALNASGAVRGSARLSLESAACLVAFDPSRTDAARIAAAARSLLASRGLVLVPLRVIPSPRSVPR